MSDGALGWLEWSPLVWIGQRSYGLYLWHYPLLWILHRHMGVHWVPVLAVAFLVTATSYRYVEQPIMRHRSHARKVQPQLALRSRAIGSTEWLA